jgi:hypothetical protein
VTPKQRALAAVAAVAFVGGSTWLAGRPRPKAPATITALPPASVASAAPADAGPEEAPATLVYLGEGGAGTCAVLEAANRAVLATVDGGPCKPAEPQVGCTTTRTGVTWGWEVVSSKSSDENSNPPDSGDWSDFYCSSETTVQLVRIDAKGVKTIGPKEQLDQAWYHQYSLSIRVLVDYDGDGELEVLRERAGKEHEGGPVGETSMLTFTKGAIAEYAPASTFHLEAVDDADGDGRPDLVTRGPYGGVDSHDAFGNAWPAGPAFFLAHAQPDGSFALGDAASVAFTRGKCPSRPSPSFQQEDLQFANGAEGTIVCARLWGTPERDLVRAIDNACAQPPDAEPLAMPCGTWAKELAAIAPPFTLK